ncbi:hypothetical protein KFU94_12745 [Chloroflexi bacterium TSY]|nr:hypothetical protein [Chloroflexi bacterium TSY]
MASGVLNNNTDADDMRRMVKELVGYSMHYFIHATRCTYLVQVGGGILTNLNRWNRL